MLYHNRTAMFEVIGSREEGHAPKLEQMSYAVSGQVAVPEGDGYGPMAQEALE